MDKLVRSSLFKAFVFPNVGKILCCQVNRDVYEPNCALEQYHPSIGNTSVKISYLSLRGDFILSKQC